jgi:hypothetical protein
MIFLLNAWMNIPTHRLELPPEAEPTRDFIEALVTRYESQIEELKQDKNPKKVPARLGGGMLAFFRVADGLFDRKIQRFERFCPVVKAPFAPLATSSTGGGAALTSG